MHDRVLCLSADTGSHPAGGEIRLQEVLVFVFYEELQSAGVEGEHEDRGRNGI